MKFWFEFASTYSYLAAARIEALAAAANVEIDWKPFLLGPIFKSQGWNDSPFNIYPAKGRYMWRDMERLCATCGLPLQRPSQFPRNGLLAARVTCAVAEQPWVGRFVAGVYRANFGADRDIAAPDTLAAVLAELGQPATWLEQAQSPEVKQRLKENTEEAIALGVFGAPSFSVGDELFWGNDRLAEALAWSQRTA